jgi:hypothetical protein
MWYRTLLFFLVDSANRYSEEFFLQARSRALGMSLWNEGGGTRKIVGSTDLIHKKVSEVI